MSRRRRLVLVLIGILILPVAYLSGANVFLNTALASATINRNPEKLHLRWSRAWSLAPGRVSLREVAVRGQTSTLQWLAELDRVEVSLQLLPLFERHFRATSIRGSGLEFRLRRPRAEGFDPELAPEIPGLSPAALPRAPDAPARTREADREGWRIELQSVDIGALRLLWIDEHRIDTEEGALAGRLDLRLRGPLSVDDGRLELHGATLQIGRQTAARALDATISAELDPVIPARLDELEILDHLTGALELDTDETSIAVINRYLKKVPWLTVAGTGRLHTTVRFTAGKIEPESELRFESPRLSALFLDYQARGSGRLRAKASDREPPSTRLEVRFDDFEVRRDGYDEPHVRGRGFGIDVVAEGLDLRGQAEEASVEIRLPRSEVPDLSFYSAYLPQGSGASIRGGHGTLEARLRASTRSDDGEGELELHGSDVAFQMQNLTIEGDLDLTTRFSDFGIAARELALDGTHLELRDVKLSEGGKVQKESWRGTFDLTRGTLRLDEPSLEATVEARLHDSRPVVAMIAERAWLLEWFEDLLTVRDIDLETDLRVDRRALALERLELRGENLEILARLHFAQQQRRGLVYAHWRAFSVGLELGPDGRDWKLRQPRRWFVARAGFGGHRDDGDPEPQDTPE
jgi:hypothetical protein